MRSHELQPIDSGYFWSAFKKKLRSEKWNLDTYQSNLSWTALTKRVGVEAVKATLLHSLAEGASLEQFVEISPEYFRVDILGSYKFEESYNWKTGIAFEHENAWQMWAQELCKLSQLVADLKVLIGYDDRYLSKDSIQIVLQKQITRLEESCPGRIQIDSQPNWLIAFGPTLRDYTLPFQAFTLNKNQVVPLHDPDPLFIPKE